MHHNCPSVLFLIFNRPDLTQRVFARIREARPPQLFVVADGPRPDKPEDVDKCRITRSLIQVDWDCELHTLYRETNLGCGIGVSRAISWFFENVQQGIILEDDCLPNRSFFLFCGELLDLYKNDKNVFAISGTNILGEFKSKYSFIFSYFGGNWGWATWKRAWILYDYEMRQWNDHQIQLKIFNLLSDKKQFAEIKKLFDTRILTAWDYQWFFTRLAYGGLSIVPIKNLISNIGFVEQATHTTDEKNKFSCLATFDLDFPLKINPVITVNRKFDNLNAKEYGYYKNHGALLRVKKKTFNILKHLYARFVEN